MSEVGRRSLSIPIELEEDEEMKENDVLEEIDHKDIVKPSTEPTSKILPCTKVDDVVMKEEEVENDLPHEENANGINVHQVDICDLEEEYKEEEELSVEYLRKSIDIEDIDVPISNDDLLRSLESELEKRRPDTYILTQLCRDLGEIPTNCRGKVWKELLCPGGIKAEIQWEEMAFAEQDDPNQRIIRADAPRTRAKDFPTNQREAIERSLINLLTYYCKCKNIRYKQGMNEVLAPFLLLRDASDGWTDSIVYQCFYTFIDKFLTNVYSDREFRSLQCSMRLLRLLLQYHDPILCAYLDQHDMTPELYATPWFITLFVRNESPSIAFALWDVFLLYDDPCMLHFLALALLIDNRDLVMNAEIAELPQVLARLVFKSVSHVQELTKMAIDLVSQTPSSFRKDLLLVCYRPLTDRSLPALKQMGVAPCLCIHAQEAVSHMTSKMQGSSSDLAFLILDCRPFAAFQDFHFSLSYHIDPEVVASPEAFNVLLDGFGRMKDCHFCFLGEQQPVQSGGNEDSVVDDMYVTRFVLLFLQNGFQHVSKIQGGLDSLRTELQQLDTSLQEQLIVGEWTDDNTSLKAKARKLFMGKIPTLTQKLQKAILTKPTSMLFTKKQDDEGSLTQKPLVDEDEWVEVCVRSKEILKRTSAAQTKQILFGPGKLGILFKGIDKSPITVDSIVPGGQAEESGILERGDVLTSIAGQSTRSLKFHQVMDLLHSTTRPMTLEFTHPSTRLLDVLDALSIPPRAPTMLRNGPYSLSIVWDSISVASRYQLQYSIQSEHRFYPWTTIIIKNKCGMMDHIIPAETSGTLVGLEPNEKYFLRIRCGTDTKWGVYSESSGLMSTLGLENLNNLKKMTSPRSNTSTCQIIFLPGECPDIIEHGLFYYRVLIGLRARTMPSYEAPTVDVALEKGSLIKCQEKVIRGPYVFVRLQETELWAFETTIDNAAVLERLAYEETDKTIKKNEKKNLTIMTAPTGLCVQAPTTTSIVVSWEALLDISVQKYCIQYSRNNFGAMWSTKEVSSHENTCLLNSLTSGTSYVVRIRAGYENGWGPFTGKSIPIKTLDDEEINQPKFFNTLVERATETAAIAARTVSARLTRTNSQENLNEEINEIPLIIDLNEMKNSLEFKWFDAKRILNEMEWDCQLVVSFGYIMVITIEMNRIGWGRVDEKYQLKYLLKITSKRGIKTSILFHFNKQDGNNQDIIEFYIDQHQECLKLVKERYLAINIKPKE